MGTSAEPQSGKRRDRVIRRVTSAQDRGAAAVEAAIILPVLVLLLTGVIELALLMKDHVSAESLARAGARVASAEPRFGTNTTATDNPWGHAGKNQTSSFAQDAVDAMERAAGSLPRNAINEVWVYRSNAGGRPLSGDFSTCPTTSCVRYRWIDATATTQGRFTWQGGSWNPQSIKSCLGRTDNGNGMSVGVVVLAERNFLFQVLGAGPAKITASTVMRFEPRRPEDPVNGATPTETLPGWFAGCE